MKQRFLVFLAALLLLPGLAQAKIFLEDTNDTLQVVTASGVSTMHMYASWADITTTALTPGSSTARVTTATTTTLVSSPGASTQRQIKGFSVRNNHVSSSNAITVQFFDGTNATELIKYTLLAGETLQWGEDENFRIIDASGQIKSVVTANAGTNLNTSSLLTTSAHDAAFGTAGSADTQVRTVQGIASMTPLLVNPGTASNFGITNFGSAFPTPGAAAGFTDGTNMVAGRVVTSAPGTSDAGLVVRPISPASSTVGSAVPSVGVQVTGTDGTNARAFKTDTNGELQVDVLTMPNVTIGTAIPAGNNNIGDVDVASLPALPAGSNTIGNVGVLPTTSGGTTPCYITSAATTNATNCKASAGQLYGYDLVNTTATIYYLRLYNLATAPTCSSATGFVRTIPIPASTTGAGIARSLPVGEAYGTGLGFCLTGGGSSTDNTNAATGVYVSLNYK